MKASKVLFNISAVICFIIGALYTFTLVFIPIGVYCFIASRRFAFKADHLFEDYSINNKTLKNWVIFASIACFPLGLISIIPYMLITSNNVKVSGTTIKLTEDTSEVDFKPELEEKAEEETTEEATTEDKVDESAEETYEEKVEKFKKLENFKEKGIITEEELEMAREQLFGKEEKKKTE